MDLIDVSVPIREGMVIYDGDPPVHLSRAKAIARGDAANVGRIEFGLHSGTHVDAPLHFLDGGSDASTLQLDSLVGLAWVIDASDVVGELRAEHLARAPAFVRRILLRTSNSRLWRKDEFVKDFVRLGEGCATAARERQLRALGIDYLSVGSPAVHEALLSAGIVTIEGLDLSQVSEGLYELICLPLRIVGGDGAPARALLRKLDADR